MAEFVSSQKLHVEIASLTRQRVWHCAVAFWGSGATVLLKGAPEDTKIICNLKMGGTNPRVIREFINILGSDKIRQHDKLHAKVYIGDEKAIVTSANASSNGLGLEGSAQASWEEAGVLIAAQSPKDWFDDIWRKSPKIEERDLLAAEIAWSLRQRNRPTLFSFADFDPNASGFPLISPFGHSTYTRNVIDVGKQVGGYNEIIEERLGNGHDVAGEEDRKVLQNGKWILRWEPTRTGIPNRRKQLCWHNVGGIIESAFCYDDDPSVAMAQTIESDPVPPVPFEINDRKFLAVFSKTIGMEKYELLRSDNYSGAWFTNERLELMRQIWGDLHKDFIADRLE